MNDYHKQLKIKIHRYILCVYQITENYPKSELFGMVSQFRRASVSIMLNYVEGFARRRGPECRVYKNFLDISYGSLAETKYLWYLSKDLEYITNNQYQKGIDMAEEIGAMLWKINN